AREKGVRLALIDRDVRLTLRRLGEGFSVRERLRLLGDMFKGLLGIGEKVALDVRGVPSQKLIADLLGRLKVRYPGLYRVLVEERNVIMAQRVAALALRGEGTVLVVVGAGHAREVARLSEAYVREMHKNAARKKARDEESSP
ncbi:MAG: hypothetical protein HC945_03415, partial [Nitrosarchaeum sp.]|nr:hypothetical protein [Nitrosarchaeum sp.]